jgi:hypothetical protein
VFIAEGIIKGDPSVVYPQVYPPVVPSGKEGIRKIPFVVRNGPDITVEGLKENEVVDGVLPLMVSAYGKGDQKVFLIEGSETPRSIPGWVWILHIVFGGWALYYLITQFAITS